ncbi:MerR family transcriptional regulator [Bacteriovorax sp. PP10]|uniref:MerR family transcriptional regulator n=1 Tax=Bacteriovorax antarcticus TaxID=3088717 RepID=A0ABU5VYN7_9BACT|nr:MerR family transcriptional regulator [Bacteriovorax sp. PP10]MEA9357125.1 MerR family transcriptional regulator [Bacteriovorax sp. PP10]
MFPINVVEKETNISKYLLRMWERRYSFPRPERDQKGERVYTSDDIEKLKLVKKLMEEGYRPSKIIDQALPELRELSKSFAANKTAPEADIVVLVTSSDLEEDVIRALGNHQVRKIIVINGQDDIQKLNLH